MPKPKNFTIEQCALAAQGCASQKEFMRKAPREYTTATNAGWLDVICPRGKGKPAWTKARVAEVSKLYPNRSSMRKSPHQWAYKVAKRNGWQDVLPATDNDKPAGYWTKELCLQAASKATHPRDLMRKVPGAYTAIWRNGWGDELFTQMELHAKATRNDVIYLWKANGLCFNGEQVYKIGVTSSHLGKFRIDQVAKAASTKPEVVFCRLVQDARSIEKQLLSYGHNPLYYEFDGCTEFRALTLQQVQEITALVEAQTIL